MAELLLELYSEEIPARMQKGGSEALAANISGGLKAAGLNFDEIKNYYSAQRLVFVIDGLEETQPDQNIDRKGPKIGAPEQALQGFCKSVGVANPSELTQEDGYYFYRKKQKGQDTVTALPEILQAAITSYTWPKSMRAGNSSDIWVRPLHNIICVFAGNIVALTINGKQANNMVTGHRFLAPKQQKIASFKEYSEFLSQNFVIFDQNQRQEIIQEQVAKLATKNSCEIIEDKGLFEEVLGLAEFPVPIIGNIDPEFMQVPKEVLVTSMKSHQKYFSLTKQNSDELAPHFICVANIKAEDGGKELTKGNETVLRARLSDAKFFWEQDRKQKLEDFLPKLKEVVFHNKAGSVYDKVERIQKLSGQLAGVVGADKSKAKRAAFLAKADLVSGMVEEFASLQGIMGGYYAKHGGEDEQIANAIKQHYAPAGQNDACPSDKVAVCVSLADKIDSLKTLWAAGERATGSKDPYGLRRYALGIIRLITENQINLPLAQYFDQEIQEFIIERLKHALKAEGFKHDVVSAVIFGDDILLIKNKAEALRNFLQTDDGSSLLASYKRAANILAIEEKKDGKKYDSEPANDNFTQSAEKDLYQALQNKESEINSSMQSHNFSAAMQSLSSIKPAVDKFFDSVMVNDEDKNIRQNRLCLLNKKRRFVEAIADLSKIE